LVTTMPVAAYAYSHTYGPFCGTPMAIVTGTPALFHGTPMGWSTGPPCPRARAPRPDPRDPPAPVSGAEGTCTADPPCPVPGPRLAAAARTGLAEGWPTGGRCPGPPSALGSAGV